MRVRTQNHLMVQRYIKFLILQCFLRLFTKLFFQPSPERLVRGRVIQKVKATHKDTFAPLRKVLGWPHKITAVTPLPSDAFVIQREEFHLGHTLYGHSAIEILTNFYFRHCMLLFSEFRNPAPRTVLRTSGNQGKAILVNPYIRIVAPVGKGHILTTFLAFGIFPDERHKHHLVKVWKTVSVTGIPVMGICPLCASDELVRRHIYLIEVLATPLIGCFSCFFFSAHIQ